MIEFMNKTKTVVTISGKEVARTNAIECKKDSQYYEKNVDCFYLEDDSEKGAHWYRVNSGKIGYNLEDEKWHLINLLRNTSGLIEGLIGENKKGWWSNKRNCVVGYEYYSDKIPHYIIDEKLAEGLGYVSCLWNEVWYKKANLNNKELAVITTPAIRRYKNIPFNYSANTTNLAFSTIKRQYDDLVLEIPERTSLISKYLMDKTWGVELETSNGTIPEKDIPRLGLVPLKDGSLRKADGAEPYEYTTVPLSDAKGLETIKNICSELNKRCEFDHSCSMHIHIGNVKWDKPTIIAYYILAQRLQVEMYNCFPLYKTNEIKYAGKQKNYNQPFPNIGLLSNTIFKHEYANTKEFNGIVQKYFDQVFEWMCGGNPPRETPDYNLNNLTHPQGNTKWNIGARYHWISLYSLIFQQQRTLEFRIHPGTFNQTKIVNWLFFCIAFVTYAERYTKEIISGKIKKPTINSVLAGFETGFGNLDYKDTLGTQISQYLQNYFEYRKKMITLATEKGDVFAENIEFSGDKEFKFESEGIENLY